MDKPNIAKQLKCLRSDPTQKHLQPCPRHHNQSSRRFGSKACVLWNGTENLPQFMDKKLFIHLQGGRKVSGILRGYDLFLNLVIDDALEETTPAQKHPIGMVVCSLSVLHDPLSYILHRSYAATVLRRWKFWRRCDRTLKAQSQNTVCFMPSCSLFLTYTFLHPPQSVPFQRKCQTSLFVRWPNSQLL